MCLSDCVKKVKHFKKSQLRLTGKGSRSETPSGGEIRDEEKGLWIMTFGDNFKKNYEG